MAQEGWFGRARTGTVRDVVINRFDEGSEIFVSPNETVASAFARMRAADVSQLPVIEGDRVVGLVEESDLLDALVAAGEDMGQVFRTPVGEVMVSRLETIPADAAVAELLPLFRRGLVPLVMDGDEVPRARDPHRPHQPFPGARPMIEKNQLAFDTRCIHAGQAPDPTTGAVMMPIYATSTYAQESPGVHKGYEYARSQNPTRMAFERCIADLEGGTGRLRLRLRACRDRDRARRARSRRARRRLGRPLRRHAAAVRARAAPLGRARHHLCRPLEPRCGAGGAEAGDEARLDRDADQSAAQALRPRGDRRRLRRRRGRWLAADNTFASPYVQRPLEYGFDLVVHSATKYLNGHSDMVGGVAVVGHDAELGEKLAFLQNAVGAIAGPFDSFLALARLEDAGAAHGAALRLGAQDRASSWRRTRGSRR